MYHTVKLLSTHCSSTYQQHQSQPKNLYSATNKKYLLPHLLWKWFLWFSNNMQPKKLVQCTCALCATFTVYLSTSLHKPLCTPHTPFLCPCTHLCAPPYTPFLCPSTHLCAPPHTFLHPSIHLFVFLHTSNGNLFSLVRLYYYLNHLLINISLLIQSLPGPSDPSLFLDHGPTTWPIPWTMNHLTHPSPARGCPADQETGGIWTGTVVKMSCNAKCEVFLILDTRRINIDATYYCSPLRRSRTLLAPLVRSSLWSCASRRKRPQNPSARTGRAT